MSVHVTSQGGEALRGFCLLGRSHIHQLDNEGEQDLSDTDSADCISTTMLLSAPLSCISRGISVQCVN